LLPGGGVIENNFKINKNFSNFLNAAAIIALERALKFNKPSGTVPEGLNPLT
jgi:hypothetical protein